MKNVIDNFSQQASTYKRYRPLYPSDLYDFILSVIEKRQTCWDCGTGNGQVAQELSHHFTQVYATDISQKQLASAKKRDNIIYLNSRAEKTPFKPEMFDLITVGQAAHWFDMRAFCNEVKRVGKSGGIVCVWGYDLLRITPQIDNVINTFYTEIVGLYWDRERKHVETHYNLLEFDFEALDVPRNLKIRTEWTLGQLRGYLESWSSVQKYKRENNNENPVELIYSDLEKHWKEGEIKQVHFPLFMRCGQI